MKDARTQHIIKRLAERHAVKVQSSAVHSLDGQAKRFFEDALMNQYDANQTYATMLQFFGTRITVVYNESLGGTQTVLSHNEPILTKDRNGNKTIYISNPMLKKFERIDDRMKEIKKAYESMVKDEIIDQYLKEYEKWRTTQNKYNELMNQIYHRSKSEIFWLTINHFFAGKCKWIQNYSAKKIGK